MTMVPVIYWSGTGNTQAMAQAVAEGIREAGGEARLLSVEEISAGEAAKSPKLALGCPAMGAEVLEESEFEPFFAQLEGALSGKEVALFGSYGWGDGQWMRDWSERTQAAGATLCAEPVICNETPDAPGLEQCRQLGRKLV